MVPLTCPKCGKQTHTTEQNVGRTARCSSCDAVFEIPAPRAAPRRKLEALPELDIRFGRRRRALLAILAAIAIGLAWWKIAEYRRGRPDAQSADRGVVIHGRNESQPDSGKDSPLALPVMTDGHFAPGGIALVMRELKEYADRSDQIVAALSGGERVAVTRTVGPRTIVAVLGEQTPPGVSTTMPATQPADGPGPTYAGGAVFSPDGKHLAWIANLGGADRQAVVFDGQVGAEYAAVGMPTFSADSSHLAYPARKPGGTWCVVVNGKEQQSQYVATGQMALSFDGKRVAYVAGAGPGKSVMVVDGMPLTPHPYIAAPRFSPDGRRVVYVAADNANQSLGPPWRIVDNEVPGKAFNYIDPDSIQFTPDGKRLIYRAYIAEKSSGPIPWYVAAVRAWKPVTVIDGKEIKGDARFQFSDDATHELHSVASGNAAKPSFILEVDGFKGPPFEGLIDSPRFSPDGRHYAFFIDDHDDPTRHTLFVDGIELKKELVGRFICVKYVSAGTIRVILAGLDMKLRQLELRLLPARQPTSKSAGIR